MERELSPGASAYFGDRYQSDVFRIDQNDGEILADYLKNKAAEEANVAKNESSEHWRFLGIVVGIPLL